MINIEYQAETPKPQYPTVLLKDIPDGTVFTGQTGSYPHHLFMKVKTFEEGTFPQFYMVALDHQKGYGPDLWNYPDLEIKNYRPVNIQINVFDIAPDF